MHWICMARFAKMISLMFAVPERVLWENCTKVAFNPYFMVLISSEFQYFAVAGQCPCHFSIQIQARLGGALNNLV